MNHADSIPDPDREHRHGPRDRRRHDCDPVTNDDLEEALARHAREERAFIQEILDQAFPDGPARHGEYHRKLITAARAEEEFWKAAKVEILKHGISGLLWTLLLIMGLALFGLAVRMGFAVTPFIRS